MWELQHMTRLILTCKMSDTLHKFKINELE